MAKTLAEANQLRDDLFFRKLRSTPKIGYIWSIALLALDFVCL